MIATKEGAVTVRKPPNAGKGRPKGALNKATQEFRRTVQDLLDANTDNVGLWLEQVARGNGDPTTADPAKALDLLVKLAEFAAPKLGRVEMTGLDGAPIAASVTINFAASPKEA